MNGGPRRSILRAHGARGEGGVLNRFSSRATNAILEGLDPRHPVDGEGGQGLQEHRVLQDGDLPQAWGPGLLDPDCSGLCYPLKTGKSPKKAVLPCSRCLASRATSSRHGTYPRAASEGFPPTALEAGCRFGAKGREKPIHQNGGYKNSTTLPNSYPIRRGYNGGVGAIERWHGLPGGGVGRRDLRAVGPLEERLWK